MSDTQAQASKSNYSDKAFEMKVVKDNDGNPMVKFRKRLFLNQDKDPRNDKQPDFKASKFGAAWYARGVSKASNKTWSGLDVHFDVPKEELLEFLKAEGLI